MHPAWPLTACELTPDVLHFGGLHVVMLHFRSFVTFKVSRREATDFAFGDKEVAPGCMMSSPSTWALCTAGSRHKLPDRAASLHIDSLKVMVAHSTFEDDDRRLATLSLLTLHCLLRIRRRLNRQMHKHLSSEMRGQSSILASLNKESSEVRCCIQGEEGLHRQERAVPC
jgi:hypothetical protein